MSKYNIYLLLPDNTEQLVERLDKEGLAKVSSKTLEGVKFDFYLTKDGHQSSPWWKKQYQEFIPAEYAEIRNRSYTAAMIATTTKHTYAITMGKAHFYVNEFSDLDFGIDIAQRIGDRTKSKMKNSDFFGGIRDKSITSNTDYYELDFQSGESVSFLKMRPSTEDWGKSAITFGNSVQFTNIDISPKELGGVLTSFDETLLLPPKFPIPRSRKVTSEKEIARLDKYLAELVEQGADDMIKVFDYDQFGVTMVFADDLHISMKFLNQTYELDNNGSISIKQIKEFCTENGFSFEGIMEKLEVVMEQDGVGRKIIKPIKEMLDFKTEDGHYLRSGKWYRFNEDFVEDLHTRVSQIEVSDLDFEFKEAEYKEWQIGNDGVKYKEYYYNSEISRLKGYELYDRKLDYRNRHRFEVCDMFDRTNKTLIVTKRGEPIDLGYAIDQASTVAKLVNNSKYKTQQTPKRTLPVKRIKLLLIFKKRLTRITSLSEIDSITFQNKMNDLYTLCREKGIALDVTLGYEAI